MAILKCKMCGGDLEVTPGMSVAECIYCGTQQTLIKSDDEGIQSLFNRANVLRMRSEFDKASDIYEKILQRNEEEAEAYWGLILCKYGIEYVEDPETFKRVPTCHRASYDAVTADEDYKNAIKYADFIQKKVYEEEAATIEEIQKGIIALAQKEEPYDIFICYKETDVSGKRTQDSVIANDIYHQLKQEGFKVFYAAISLEDKLGKEYEPYIFSALNTAKVMLALGTKPEYFNAVWVKNEWSRFLKIMKKDHSKLLIPCYRDMDPYELPEEFAHLQAQDMSKIGFINDLVRGIKKVIVKESAQAANVESTTNTPVYATNVTALLKRGNMALEDHEWDKADGFFEEVLNQDAECAEAYLGKLLAKKCKENLSELMNALKNQYINYGTKRLEACKPDTAHIDSMVQAHMVKFYLEADRIRKEYEYDLGYDSALSSREKQKAKQNSEISSEKLLTRALQYAKGDTKRQIEDGIVEIKNVLEERILEAKSQDSASIEQVKTEYAEFLKVTDQKVCQLEEDAKERREQEYKEAVATRNAATDIPSYKNAINALGAMNGYKDTADLAAQCQGEIDRLQEEIDRLQEEERIREEERKRQEEEEREKLRIEKKKKAIKTLKIVSAIVATCVVVVLVITQVILPAKRFDAEVAAIAAAKVGDEISYGTYQGETIEWKVLDVKDGKALLISEKALDSQPYNIEYESVTWETCSLRTWLNGSFVDEAFSNKEQGLLVNVTVTADSNPEWGTEAGNDTSDKVFLLSIDEVKKYLSGEDRICEPTEYAISQGAHTSYDNSVGGNAICWWWLRSPGKYTDLAAYVYFGSFNGSVYFYGNNVGSDDGSVRPALWINLEP